MSFAVKRNHDFSSGLAADLEIKGFNTILLIEATKTFRIWIYSLYLVCYIMNADQVMMLLSLICT